MGFTGLVPSEYSSGGSTRRGYITKTGKRAPAHPAGRVCLVLPAPPYVGAELRKRHEGLPAETIARSWAAQRRLCGRFRRLVARKDIKTVVVTAIARELAGFLWGRDDRLTHEPIRERHVDRRGHAPKPATRRGTAVAGKIPVRTMAPASSGTQLVRGTILRITDFPVPIREHQSGGPPIHAASTRRAHPAARPPPLPQSSAQR
jgi:hypothetical protein